MTFISSPAMEEDSLYVLIPSREPNGYKIYTNMCQRANDALPFVYDEHYEYLYNPPVAA